MSEFVFQLNLGTAAVLDIRPILDDVRYNFRFRYNNRDNQWYFDIKDIAGNAIILNEPCVTSTDVLRDYGLEGLPPGKFEIRKVRDVTAQHPDRNGWVSDFRFIYHGAN